MIFKSWSLSKKVNSLLLVPLVAFALALHFFLVPLFAKSAFEAKKEATRISVELAYGVLKERAAQAASGELSLEQAQEAAKKDVRVLRYNQSEYFWIQDRTPKMIAHAIKPELDGKDLSDMKDPNGKFVFVEFAKAVENPDKAGFVEYEWPKPGQEKPQPKISFVKEFPEWGWIVGSGVYVDDVQTIVRDMQIKIWSGFLIILVFAYGIGTIISRDINRRLKGVSERLVNAGHKVSNSIDLLTSAGTGLSSSATESAAALAETVASLEELTAMVRRNSTHAEEAAILSETSKATAQKGESELKALMSSMNEITVASKKIEEIINVIDDIAFQTNLLALNAAVEAARAGDQGRGFAVVADAVRSLAQRSSVAAKDIHALIKDSVSKINTSATIADRSGEVLAEIVSSVSKVASLNAEISTASKEQSNGIGQINIAMNNLDKTSQKNAEAAEEISTSSQGISALAKETKDLTGDLNSVIQGSKAA